MVIRPVVRAVVTAAKSGKKFVTVLRIPILVALVTGANVMFVVRANMTVTVKCEESATLR